MPEDRRSAADRYYDQLGAQAMSRAMSRQERPLSEDEKLASQIKVRTERFIVDSRYKSKADWFETVSPQEVLRLVNALNAAMDLVAVLQMSRIPPLLTLDTNTGEVTEVK